MRMNISVPDELAERVRALDLPISSVCQKALSAEADAAEKRAKMAGDLTTVAARLRQSIDDEASARFQEGCEQGAEWAREWATYAELRELAGDFLSHTYGAPHTIVDYFGSVLEQHVTSINTNDDTNYWEGFVHGAQTVWEAVQPLI